MKRFTSRKFLAVVAAAVAPWVAPGVEIDPYVKLTITSVLAVLYLFVEGGLDRKNIDLAIENKFNFPVEAPNFDDLEDLRRELSHEHTVIDHTHVGVSLDGHTHAQVSLDLDAP